MQKFTRALTREIEIDNQRIAVTMDEKGLTIRPVGSRRPPKTLTWAAALAATTEAAASPQDASAPEQPHQEASPPPAEASTDLPSLLARLDAWLSKHRRRYHDGLQPAARPQQLTALEQTLGRPLPQELHQLLAWHNGQKEDLIGAFVEAWNLMSAEEIGLEYAERKKNSDPPWNDSWMPFLDDGQGDLVLLDSATAGGPVRELWRGRQEPETVAPSLTAWVAKFLADLEAGRYHEDPERGEFRLVTDR
jgi:cell wall assembly regulator SMI1